MAAHAGECGVSLLTWQEAILLLICVLKDLG